VCVGLKAPQAPAGAQAQSTPALLLSFETVAVNVAVPPAAREVGAPLTLTETVGGGVVVWLDPPPHPAIARIIEKNTEKHVAFNKESFLPGI